MSEINPFDGYIEIHEAAQRYPKSLDTLRRWIRQGKLPSYKFGRDVYLKHTDLTPKPVTGPVRRVAQK